eukprot:3351043-Amphidinium_carterae.1
MHFRQLTLHGSSALWLHGLTCLLLSEVEEARHLPTLMITPQHPHLGARQIISQGYWKTLIEQGQHFARVGSPSLQSICNTQHKLGPILGS